MSMISAGDSTSAIYFWMSALCMAAAGLLAPGAVIGIAAFPLFAASVAYALKGFRVLPSVTQRPRPVDYVWFVAGLLGAEFFSLVHGSIAFALTHPGSGALPPPFIVTMLLGLVPVALCIYAVDRRTERGHAIAASFLLGFVVVNPVVLFVGKTLQLPVARTW